MFRLKTALSTELSTEVQRCDVGIYSLNIVDYWLWSVVHISPISHITPTPQNNSCCAMQSQSVLSNNYQNILADHLQNIMQNVYVTIYAQCSLFGMTTDDRNEGAVYKWKCNGRKSCRLFRRDSLGCLFKAGSTVVWYSVESVTIARTFVSSNVISLTDYVGTEVTQVDAFDNISAYLTVLLHLTQCIGRCCIYFPLTW